MSRKSKDHLKFTLFPFVSILLAVVGVMLFLTMLQSILLKGSSSAEKKKQNNEENTRVYERIPELNTTVLTVLGDSYEVKRPDGTETSFASSDLNGLLNELNSKLLSVNFNRAKNEDSRREHLLFVVDSEGVKNYFFFRKNIEFFNTVNPNLPTGLILLNPGEKFKLK